MKLRTLSMTRWPVALALALALALRLALAPAAASQQTLVTPGSPLSMSGLASFLNGAFLSIGSCNAGPSAPANGTGGAAFPGECWINTTANPWVFSYTADGTHWSEFGTLNTSTFVWTPYNALIPGNNLSDVSSAATALNNLFGTAAAHYFWAGPTSGSAGNPTMRALVGTDLPAPGASSLGGIEAVTCATHNWLNTISTAGIPACGQPGFADLSGALATTQLPALASANIWVGNGSGVATAVAVSGDGTLSNAGVLTITKTNGTAFGPLATASTAPIGNGGTGQTTASAAFAALAPTPTRAGDLVYWNGSAWVTLAGQNSATSLLQESAAGVPSWLATVPVALGGTNCATASGTCLDNITGFSSTGFLTRTAAGTYAFQSATNGITLGNLAQISAYTLLGNPNASAANIAAFTIASLTNKTAPTSADLVMISDQAASGALKYSTVAQLIAAVSSGVTTIGNAASDTSITFAGTGSGPYSGAVTARVTNPVTATGPTVCAGLPGGTCPTSGSGTYTTPAGVKWIRIRMVGGGQGGGGSGTGAGGGAGGAGGNTTFGSSLLAANGASSSYAGGSASLGSGPIGFAIAGGSMGDSSGPYANAGYFNGVTGCSSPFGGAGGGTNSNSAGLNAVANSGSGGGGGGTGGPALNVGQGGACGGYVDAIINSPSATYPYAVGSGGSAGSAGTSGQAGGTGGSGFIIVEEHYNY